MWMLPPALVNVSLEQAQGKSLTLWLPAFILWPLWAVILAIVSPLVIALALASAFSKRARSWLCGAIGAARTLSALHGLEFSAQRANGDAVRVHIL